MATTITISSVNFNGESANITFYPDNGDPTINFGIVTIPYTTSLDYIYGDYEIYVIDYNQTCFVYFTNYLLQENQGEILQENDSNILW